MTTDNKSLSFGRYLRAIRLKKGISLEEVSWETKIGMNILVLIEQEDLGRLPREVYVKGFLRSYAKAIDTDGDHAVQNYASSLKIFKNSIRSETDLERSDKAFWTRLLLSLGALVGYFPETGTRRSSGHKTRSADEATRYRAQIIRAYRFGRFG
ncbi:MAG: helix-turn-helix domain-containing protein [Deltaproteobacteria bacterium]|nr:helix-turn-helix domain-containing protein [Deltaproteobacteria bacterium]